MFNFLRRASKRVTHVCRWSGNKRHSPEGTDYKMDMLAFRRSAKKIRPLFRWRISTGDRCIEARILACSFAQGSVASRMAELPWTVDRFFPICWIGIRRHTFLPYRISRKDGCVTICNCKKVTVMTLPPSITRGRFLAKGYPNL